jgi:hypothetical protein
MDTLAIDGRSGERSAVRGPGQVTWKDPATGYLRRIISPPHPNLRRELVEVSLPAGASVSYDASPLPGLEHYLWMLDGSVAIEIEGTSFRVEKGDCVRYVLSGSSRFECRSKRPARYLVALVHT